MNWKWKCPSLSTWPGMSAVKGSHGIPHLLLSFWENMNHTLFCCFSTSWLIKWSHIPQISLFTAGQSNGSQEEVVRLNDKFHVVSCFPHWRWSVTLCWKGFKLYRFIVCVCLYFKHPHHCHLYSSILFLHSLFLHPSVFRAGNLLSASMQFHTALSARVVLESCALV